MKFITAIDINEELMKVRDDLIQKTIDNLYEGIDKDVLKGIPTPMLEELYEKVKKELIKRTKR